MTTLGLDRLAGRCAAGYDLATQHPRLCQCGEVAHAKRAGISRANRNAPDPVKEKVDAAILRLARTGEPFSANDMRVELVGVAGPVVGGRFTVAHQAGLIVPTGERVVSNLKSTNGHEVKVWVGVMAA